MTPVRILVLSGSRPLRARRVAEGILREMPDGKVCGVVQQAWSHLPVIQRRIATGDVDGNDSSELSSRLALLVRKLLRSIVHRLLWCTHGFPRPIQAKTTFTIEDLEAHCRRAAWPFLVAACPTDKEVIEFASGLSPDLMIVAGEHSLNQDLLDVPSLGSIQVLAENGSDDSTTVRKDTKLKVQYHAQGTDRARPLASVTVPVQMDDGPISETLKNDLIADDLLLQAAKSLGQAGEREAAKEVEDWTRRMLAPYLDQLRLTASARVASSRRHRSILKLAAESLVFFPRVMAINLYRHVRRRYPVLILGHHLVSDRPHSMGMPTEELWRRIRFLQKHYRIASLPETESILRSGRVNVPTVVLTFDDGYCDNYITLRAVAEETGAKIAVFIATGQVELHKEFDHDLAAGVRGFFPLSWDQIEDWSRRGVEFGSHTRTHIDCGSRDRAKLEAEVAGSARDLEMRLRQPCRFFAFPFGKHENMSPEALEIAAATYSSFLSSYGGENLPREGHRAQHLLRKGFYSDPWELELELQSVFDLVRDGRARIQRVFDRLRANLGTQRSWSHPLWTLLHACLLLLAVFPPFRRVLDETNGDR